MDLNLRAIELKKNMYVKIHTIVQLSFTGTSFEPLLYLIQQH